MADRKTTYAFVGEDKFSKVAGKVSKSAGAMGTKFAKAGKVAAAGAAVVGTATVAAGAAFGLLAVKAAKSASNLEETLNKSRVVFGKNSAAIEKWGASAAKNLGLSQQAAVDAASGFGMMFDQMGFGRGATQQMSVGLVNLSADLASFHNLTGGAAEATDMMSAALRGEYDSLQRVIPTINAAAVQNKAMEMTGKDSAKALTEQEKAAATYALIIEGAGKATGDFARTSDGMANKARTLSAQWQNLTDKIGKKFLPAVSGVVAFVADHLVPAFDRAFDVLGDVARVIGQAVRPQLDKLSGQALPDVDEVLNRIIDRLPDLAAVAFEVVNGVVKVFRFMANVILNVLSGIASGLATLFGWISQDLRDDAKAFQIWKDNTLANLDSVTAGMDDTADALRRLGVETRQTRVIDIVVRTSAVEGTASTRVLDAIKRQQAEAKAAASDAVASVNRTVTDTVKRTTTATKKATTAAKTATKKVSSAVKITTADLKSAFTGVMNTVRDAFDAAKERIRAFHEEAASLGNNISRGLGDFGEGVTDFAERMAEAVSPAKMLDNMQRSANAVDDWRRTLAAVASRGLPNDIVEELRAMGLDSADELSALSRMTDAELKRFAALWRHRDASGAAEGAKQFADDIAAEVASLPARLKQVGADAMQGLADSVGSKAPQVTAQVKKALRAMADDISSEEALFAFEFDFTFVPKKSSSKRKKKPSSSKKGSSSKGGVKDGFNVGHGLMAATHGSGSPGARFAQWGPYWSWNRNSSGMGQHDGADIKAGYGTPVYATRSGRVTFAGWSSARRWAGNHVVWESGGTRFTYAHLSRTSRGVGNVSAGAMLGRVGSTGNSTGPHLHVQASRSGHYVNPAYYLAAGGIVRKRPGGTLAVIGEGRHDEAVVPLDGKNHLGGGAPVTVQLVLDGKVIQQSIVNYERSTGRPILTSA